MLHNMVFSGDTMSQKKPNAQTVDEARREFLRKSVYAAYATPVITALLVSEASAAQSANANPGACKKAGGTWYGTGNNGCCDLKPGDVCGPNG
jgi:hypothetical protein